MEDEVDYTLTMKNLRSWDVNKFIDCDLWLGEIDEDGIPIDNEGQWVPHTVSTKDERFADIVEQCGPVEIIPKPRDVQSRLNEALSKGVEWNGERLMVKNQNERDRLLSAATRMSINNTLPKNKSSFGYMLADGGYTEIPKKDVVEVAMLVQDYAEDCHDNYMRLVNDETLDEYSGWPD